MFIADALQFEYSIRVIALQSRAGFSTKTLQLDHDFVYNNPRASS